MDDFAYMRQAMELAEQAAALGEIPVGALVVRDATGAVLGRGYTRREVDHAHTAHAEVLAIRQAALALGSWRLSGCTLYVTLEPCPMCAGAILNARIARVFYGARDAAMGACGGVLNLFMENFPHHPQLVGGICAEESRALLASFFARMREK